MRGILKSFGVVSGYWHGPRTDVFTKRGIVCFIENDDTAACIVCILRGGNTRWILIWINNTAESVSCAYIETCEYVLVCIADGGILPLEQMRFWCINV